MANEFVARRGIIAQSGGAKITGSLLVSGAVDATGYNIIATSFTGSFSGSIGTATTASYVSPSGLPAGTVSSSTQVINNIQNQTISPSTIYVTTIDATTISGSTISGSFVGNGSGLTGVVAAGTVSQSSQIDITQTTNYGLVATLAGANVFTNINTFAATGSYGTVKIVGPAASEASIAFKTTDVADGTSGDWILGTNQALLNTKQFGLWNGANSSVFPLVVDPNGQVGINLNRATAQNVTAPLTVVGNTNITGSLVVTGGITGSILANNGVVSSSNQVIALLPTDTVSSSTQVTAFLPIGTVSSSAQYPGWVTASSQISISATTGYTTFSSSLATVDQNQQSQIDALISSTSSYALQTQLAGVASSSSQVKAYLPDGTVSASAQYPGWVTASSQVNITATTGYSTFSSSIATKNDSQDAAINALSGVTGSYATTASNSFTGVQTITNTTNSTTYTDGALVVHGGVGIEKDVNISGSVNIIGLLTVTSQSIQYVTGSIYDVGTNKITVNTTNALRFGGISVNDSGSAPVNSGSLYWDSYTNRWIYENLSGAAYNSAILIAGPKNTGSLGDETSLIVGRIPVAQADDHISTDASLTPLRVEGSTLHIEGNAYATGSITASAFTGDGSQLTGIVTTLYVTGSDASAGTVNLKTQGLTITGANGISTSVSGQTVTVKAPLGTVSSSGQVKSLLPDGTVSSSAQYPGWVTASSQIDITATTGYSTFSSSLATVDQGQQSQINALISSTSSYALQSQLAGVASSSSQVKAYLPGGTVSSSAQYAGWVTASSQILLDQITGATFSNQAFLFPSDVQLNGDLTVAGNDIKNNNGTAVITFAGTGNNDVRLTAGGALDVYSGEIRNSGITAIQMSGQNVQILNSGSMNAAKINNTYYSGSTPSTIIGPVSNQVIATLIKADYDAAHFDYVVKDGTNYRTGVVMAVWNGSNVEFTDTSTNDIGNTSSVSFTVDINSGLARLKITTGTGSWTVKTSIRAL